MAICPSKCICNEETLVVTCDRANLDGVPITLNPGIRQLMLKNNNIKAVIAAFNFYNDLEYLDLTHNKLVALETNSFEVQVNLQVLKLSRNQISHVVNNTFAGLRNLKVLHLDENILETLPDRVFVYLKNIEELDLTLNRISSIAPEAFFGLGSLRTLRLRDNKLTHVPTTSWTPLRNLFHLNLGSNIFRNIPGDVFGPLAALQELVLDSCSVRDVATDAFRGLQHLRMLRLRDNLLTMVPTHAWQHLPGLEEIFLGQNHFDEVRANAFAGLARLRVVEISGAQRLAALRASAFTPNADLRKVVMNHNLRFSVIETGAFDGLPSLRHLSLREDAFRTFADDVLAWDELDTLDLRDNPLECNCSLAWLRTLLQNKNLTLESSADTASVLSSVAIRCQTPSSLGGRLLSELTGGDLGCNFPNARQQALFGIIGAAVVACLLTLILLVYKYRKRVTSVLKDKWPDGVQRRKDLHYEKTYDEEENNILQAAQQSLKMTPVTEL